jgi:hypothetical protein
VSCRVTSSLRYRGVDQYGKPIDRTVQDFHARVVQHEVDHLLGILYPMRIRDMRSFGLPKSSSPVKTFATIDAIAHRRIARRREAPEERRGF